MTAGLIGSFRVSGQMSGNLHTNGNLISLTVGSLIGSDVTVGNTDGLTTATTANIGTALLGTLRVTGGGTTPVFNDSTVVAHTINSATTGRVNAAGTAGDEGIAAVSIRTATVNVNGGLVRLNAAALASNASLTAYLSAKGGTLGSFVIDIV